VAHLCVASSSFAYYCACYCQLDHFTPYEVHLELTNVDTTVQAEEACLLAKGETDPTGVADDTVQTDALEDQILELFC
jgi:hypothetical protein